MNRRKAILYVIDELSYHGLSAREEMEESIRNAIREGSLKTWQLDEALAQLEEMVEMDL